MGTSPEKRARQAANRQAGDQLTKTNDAQQRRRSMAIGAAALVISVVIVVLIVIFTGGKGSKKNEAANGSGSKNSTSTTAAAGSSTSVANGKAAELPTPPKGATLTEATKCPPESGSNERVQKFSGPPPTCIKDGETYTAVFDTTEGSFTASLDSKAAPIAVNNFVVLSRYHFYDGVPFHRIVPGFVIQGGDGDGPPWGNNDLGYSFADELPKASTAYTDYSLAMANSGPNTNGSQFFVVLPGGGAQLQPLYTRFGQVTEGQDVIDKIGALGNASQEPTNAVVINSVKIDSTKG